MRTLDDNAKNLIRLDIYWTASEMAFPFGVGGGAWLSSAVSCPQQPSVLSVAVAMVGTIGLQTRRDDVTPHLGHACHNGTEAAIAVSGANPAQSDCLQLDYGRSR